MTRKPNTRAGRKRNAGRGPKFPNRLAREMFKALEAIVLAAVTYGETSRQMSRALQRADSVIRKARRISKA
jgi:hypothetical protein